MSAERLDPEFSERDDELVLMSDGAWVPSSEVLHYGVEDEPETDDERLRKLKIGAYSAAGLGLAIFGGVTAYKHLKDK